MDIAVAGVGAWVSLDEKLNRVKQARIALSAVGPTPIFAKEASDILSGLEPNEESFELAAQQAQKAASPIDDMRGTVRQRVHLVGVLTKRALRKAVNRAKES
jgi:carbon-monoxide dehydrogenase medium subunit